MSISLAWIVLTVAWIVYAIALVRSGSSAQKKLVRGGLAALLPIAVATSLITGVYSNDLLRYRWDGHVAAHGVNPYHYAPNSPEVRHLQFKEGMSAYPDDLTYPGLRTIYPAGSQILFFTAAYVGGGTDRGFQLTLWAFVLLGAGALYWLCSPSQRVWCLVVFTSPVFVLHGAMDLHTDVFMALATAIAFALLARSKVWPSAIAIGIAITVKYLPLLALPVLYRGRTTQQKVLVTIVVVATVLVIYLPFLDSHSLESLGLFVKKWQSNSAMFALFMLVLDETMVRFLMLAIGLSAAAVIWWKYRSQPAVATALSIIAIMVASPVVHPWYLLLPVMILPFVPLRSTLVWTATVFVYGIAYENFKGNGVWYDHPVALAIEYVPVITALAVDVARGPLLLGDKYSPNGISAPQSNSVGS